MNSAPAARAIKRIEPAYQTARAQYAEVGVNTEKALRQLAKIRISLHCWQGDDVAGFEGNGSELGGGLAITGQYPGRARTAVELRSDVDKALSLLPGRHRLNLHASYAETGKRRVERDELEPAHFAAWIAWAKERELGLDFNPTFFAHPKAADGFTLTHPNRAIRRFWVEHGIACRRIAAAMGKTLGTACITNVWIPDGYKDTPADRAKPRAILTESLDAIFAKPFNPLHQRDAVESKLFGIGSESYVTGSHEYYLGYAISRGKILCLDAGHFHPTETIADKIPAILCWVKELLLHVSRGVRWDSDHVVTLSDDLKATALEVVRGNYLDRVHVGLDYFDASINRVAAWVIGGRALLKGLLMALLEPGKTLRRLELEGDYTARLAWMEELKGMPWGAVWNYHCLRAGVPPDGCWLNEVRTYERDVLGQRH